MERRVPPGIALRVRCARHAGRRRRRLEPRRSVPRVAGGPRARPPDGWSPDSLRLRKSFRYESCKSRKVGAFDAHADPRTRTIRRGDERPVRGGAGRESLRRASEGEEGASGPAPLVKSTIFFRYGRFDCQPARGKTRDVLGHPREPWTRYLFEITRLLDERRGGPRCKV